MVWPIRLVRSYLGGTARLVPGMTAFPLVVLVVAPVSGALSDKRGSRGLASLGALLCAAALAFLAAAGVVASWLAGESRERRGNDISPLS
ncbi:MAG: hypothetical protein H5U01_10240 [Clostridia bacterium]|nr:hypothetical protein [Clostridia bacterium]